MQLPRLIRLYGSLFTRSEHHRLRLKSKVCAKLCAKGGRRAIFQIEDSSLIRRKRSMDKNLLLNYLNCRRLPMSQREGSAYLHTMLCEHAPDFYLHLLADTEAHISHKREVLINILGHSAAQRLERAQILDKLRAISASEALQVLSIIRDMRINRSKARELVLTYLLDNEQLPTLAAVKRQRIAHMLCHVLGERTWSSIKRFLANPTPEGEIFLQREVLHYASPDAVTRVRESLCFLTGVPFNASDPALRQSLATRQRLAEGQGMPSDTLTGLRGIYHQKALLKEVRRLAAVGAAQAHEDGILTTLYKEGLSHAVTTPMGASPTDVLYQAFTSHEGQAASAPPAPTDYRDGAGTLAQVVEKLPAIAGQLAIVLDLSSSMASSGERLYHPAALALALTHLLQVRVDDIRLYQLGGMTQMEQNKLVLPQGTADIAGALIAAIRDQPQLVLIITDGYENERQGDTSQMLQGLRQLGLTTPVYQVAPVFTRAEKLEQHRLADDIPVIPVAHEDGIRELLARVVLTSPGENITPQELEWLQQLLTVR